MMIACCPLASFDPALPQAEQGLDAASSGGLLADGLAGLGGAANQSVLEALAVCALAVGALLVLSVFVRRLTRGAWRSRAARRSLEMLDLLPLGGQRRVAVLRCYDRTFLVGLGDKEVSLLAELDPPTDVSPEPSAAKDAPPPEAPSGSSESQGAAAAVATGRSAPVRQGHLPASNGSVRSPAARPAAMRERANFDELVEEARARLQRRAGAARSAPARAGRAAGYSSPFEDFA